MADGLGGLGLFREVLAASVTLFTSTFSVNSLSLWSVRKANRWKALFGEALDGDLLGEPGGHALDEGLDMCLLRLPLGAC